MKPVLIILLLFPLSIFSQDTDAQISQIREWYKDIEGKVDDCLEVVIDGYYDEVDNFGEGYVVLKGYYHKESGELIKVVEELSAEWREATNSYYLHEGTLFFIFSQGYYGGDFYSADELGLDEDTYWEQGREAKTIAAYEGRKYFHNESCIRFLRKDKMFDASLSKRSMSGVDNVTEDTELISYEEISGWFGRMIKALNGAKEKF